MIRQKREDNDEEEKTKLDTAEQTLKDDKQQKMQKRKLSQSRTDIWDKQRKRKKFENKMKENSYSIGMQGMTLQMTTTRYTETDIKFNYSEEDTLPVSISNHKEKKLEDSMKNS